MKESTRRARTEAVKAEARRLGADLVGVAPVERFAGAPARMSPQGLLPEARSVVVMAVHHPDAAIELGGEPRPQDVGPYSVQYWMNSRLDDMSYLMARYLEKRGHRALPIAASNIWRYHAYKDLKVDFAPDLVHRYAAVAAGLGEIGWSGLTLTPEFGPRNRFVSVVTDADLEPTPMYDGPALCDRCMACVKHCPTDAFRKEVRGINHLEIGGRHYEFPATNKWRCAWAENFDLNLALEIPGRVDEAVILENLEKYGRHGGEMGSCLKFCMVPQLRYDAPEYCRAPRRRKPTTETSPEKLLARVRGLFDASMMDVMAVGAAQDFPEAGQVHPALHLPDAVSVISLGIREPPGAAANAEIKQTLRRQLRYASYEVDRALDLRGYSAVSGTRIHDTLVAQRLGVFDADVQYATVLTSAPLPRATFRCEAAGRGGTGAAPSVDALRAVAREAGADLVGVFAVDRFEAFRDALLAGRAAPQPGQDVEDRGLIYGPFAPAIVSREAVVKRPEDWLPGARSVIVLGLHLPDTAVDRVKAPPAETAGPYVFVCYESLNLLRDMAMRVVQSLNRAGRRAVPTTDLCALASWVQSPRGLLPDMRANRFAALLAGLATIGVNGCPLTPEYGVRQRFIAIVTDLPLASDPLAAGESACDACDRPCVGACPTSALCGEAAPIKIEGRTFTVPVVDRFACDWAARYALSGGDGGANCGSGVDLGVPQDRSVSALAAAVATADWGVQKRLLTIAEECIRVCPARGAGR